MFDVIDDKPEGFIMYKYEPVGRGFIHYHINHERVYVLHKGFIVHMYQLKLRLDYWKVRVLQIRKYRNV